MLGYEPWGPEQSRTGHGGQVAIGRALAEHRDVAVYGGRGVSKTDTAAWLACWFLCTRPDSMVVSTAPSDHQVKNQLWRRIRGFHATATRPLPGQTLIKEWHIGPRWYGVGLSTDTPDRFQGFHAQGGVLFLVDEASGVQDMIFDAGAGFGTDAGSKRLYIGNPLRRRGAFYKACQPGSGFAVIQVAAHDAPRDRISDAWFEQVRREWGPSPESDPRWVVYADGRFPTTDERAIVPLAYLELAAKLGPSDSDFASPCMGVDISGSDQGDWNAAVLLHRGAVRAIDKWREPDTMRTAARILRLAKTWGVEGRRIGVDANGIGAGVADRLRELGLPVLGVQLGAGPEIDRPALVGPDRLFLNRRAELLWHVRLMIERHRLAIASRFETLRQDLGAPEWDENAQGKLYATPKASLIPTLGRSPDEGDALLCALAADGMVSRSPRPGVSSTRKARAAKGARGRRAA